ncbi:hypothetical protein SNEBB_010497 [Seison nebaliae]|nr:hypothetical protein SNEBB_010497 [Seison nebaliae]
MNDYLDHNSTTKIHKDQYAFQPYRVRFRMYSSVRNNPNEHPELSLNLIGSCLGVVTFAALQTMPQFMLQIFHYYGHKNWTEITEKVKVQVKSPSSNKAIVENIASEFLAMELLKSWGLKLSEVENLHYGNFLEYFAVIADRNRKELTPDKFQSIGKKIINTITNKKSSVSNLPFKDSYNSIYKVDLLIDIMTVFDILFRDTPTQVAFGAYNELHQTSVDSRFQQNFFLFREAIEFVGISIRYLNEERHENDIYKFEQRVTPDTVMRFLTPTEIFRLNESLKVYMPSWVVVGFSRISVLKETYKKRAQLFKVYLPYYKTLLEMLDSILPLMLVHKRILEKAVELTLVMAELRRNSIIKDILLFNHSDIIENNVRYDVTAITYVLSISCKQLPIRSSKLTQNDPSRSEIEHCMNYQMKMLQQAFDSFERNFNNRIRDNYMNSIIFFEDMFKTVCSHLFEEEMAKVPNTTTFSHAVALTRSLDGTHWNYVSNNVVYQIDDVRLALSAFHHEILSGIFYSRNDVHEYNAEKWREIIRMN